VERFGMFVILQTRTGGLETLMKAPAEYRQLALDCVELAEAARDPPAREAMIHLQTLRRIAAKSREQ
jgi:hypothetical protein